MTQPEGRERMSASISPKNHDIIIHGGCKLDGDV